MKELTLSTQVSPNTYAIPLHPGDDDSTHVYFILSRTNNILIDAGNGEPEQTELIVNAIEEILPNQYWPAEPLIVLLTDRFEEHAGGAAALKAKYRRVRVYAGAGDVDAINALNGRVVNEGLIGGEQFERGHIFDSAFYVTAIATPGHTAGSMCYLQEITGPPHGNNLFTGDCVLSQGTTAVHLDQGGDMGAYVASLKKLAEQQDVGQLLSFHGPPVTDPAGRLADLLKHREEREKAILECLRDGVTDVDGMRERLYGAANLEEWRWNAAREQIVAHLIKLRNEGAVAEIDAGNSYRLT